MTNMTQSEIKLIENKLHKRQQELLEEVRNELDERENQHVAALMGNDLGDDGDLSLADELADLNILRVDRHIKELREIENKLSLIKVGRLNECIDCDKKIGFTGFILRPCGV